MLAQNDQRGAFATCDIKPGDQLVAVPRSASLIADTRPDKPPPFRILTPISEKFWRDAHWEVRLAVQLLDECASGDQSPFRQYVDSLPQDPWCVMWAYDRIGSPRLANQLERYGLARLADRYRAKMKSSYVALRQALPPELRSLINLKKFSWALSHAVSRGFGIPPSGSGSSHNTVHTRLEGVQKRKESVPVEYAMFPGLDMINCSVHCKTSIKYDPATDKYRIYTGSHFARGEQVYFSYGSKTNEDFMFFYGFVEGKNPANTVRIPSVQDWIMDLVRKGSENEELLQRKLDMITPLVIVHRDEDKVYEFRVDDLDEDILQILRIALANEDELDQLEELNEESPNRKSKSICLANELDVWKVIEEKCNAILDLAEPFTNTEQERLTALYAHHPCTASWSFGTKGSDGELLYRYERQTVLSSTLERVQHYIRVSSSVGRICTVLVPPSQSLLRADLFESVNEEVDTSSIRRFAISPQDLQTPPGT